MAITNDRPTSKSAQQPKKYKVLGTRPIRHDGVDKVTGRAEYGADVELTGVLHGKMLRSPHAHARIKSLDLSVFRFKSLCDISALHLHITICLYAVSDISISLSFF